MFEELGPQIAEPAAAQPQTSAEMALASRVRELENELDASRQRMSTLVEEHESSQEEMKASNEEIQSANEELRATTVPGRRHYVDASLSAISLNVSLSTSRFGSPSAVAISAFGTSNSSGRINA